MRWRNPTATQLRKWAVTALAATLILIGMHTNEVQADLVSVDSTFGAGTITLDTATGLSWLDVTLSTQFTYDEILVELGSGGAFEGFRLATRDEVLEFWENAGINVGAEFFNVPTLENFQPITDLLAFVGVTRPLLPNPNVLTAGYIESGPGGGSVDSGIVLTEPDTLTGTWFFGSFPSNSENDATGSWLIALLPEVTAEFTGTVEFVDSRLQSSFQTGDAVTGFYTYDPNTPGTNGFYNAITAYRVETGGGYAACAEEGLIAIRDGILDPPRDRYEAILSTPSGGAPDVNGFEFLSFSVFLQDTSASVYSDLSLPPVPDLESFDIDSSVFQFWNPDLPGGQKSAIVAVTLTSLTQVTGGEPSLCPIVIDETINIAGYTAGETRLFDINPVSIAVGDSVDMTVRFAGGLSLHMGYGNEWFRAWLSGTDQASSFTIENIRVQFLGFSEEGGALDLLAKGIETSGIGHMGPQFPFFLSPGQAIEFTGYRATFDVTSLDVDPNTYRNVLFRQSGDDVFVIPEPTPALLHVSALVVLAALAAAKRRALYRAPGGTPT